jgi:hypothetical protein
MISILFLEYLVAATSLLSGISIIFLINEIANMEINNCIKLKQDNKNLEEEIQKKNNSEEKYGEAKMDLLVKLILNKRITRSQLSKI